MTKQEMMQIFLKHWPERVSAAKPSHDHTDISLALAARNPYQFKMR